MTITAQVYFSRHYTWTAKRYHHYEFGQSQEYEIKEYGYLSRYYRIEEKHPAIIDAMIDETVEYLNKKVHACNQDHEGKPLKDFKEDDWTFSFQDFTSQQQQ
jgi:hypothetical protein